MLQDLHLSTTYLNYFTLQQRRPRGLRLTLTGFSGSSSEQGTTRFPCSKLKLDNLFLQWLSLPESQKLVGNGPDAMHSGCEAVLRL